MGNVSGAAHTTSGEPYQHQETNFLDVVTDNSLRSSRIILTYFSTDKFKNYTIMAPLLQ